MIMKVTLGVQERKEIIDLCSWFIAKNNTLPILQNIYIQGANNQIIRRATDMEKYIEVRMEANTQWEGSVTVDAKTLMDIIKTSDDEFVDLTIDNQKDILHIQGVRDDFLIKGISASEYVTLPEVKTTQTVSLPSATMVEWIEKVEFAVTEKTFSPIFTGVLLHLKKEQEKNYIICVWTDSYRLGEFKIPYDPEDIQEDVSVIIPKTSINDLVSIASYVTDKQKDHVSKREIAKNLVRCNYQIGDITIQATSLLIQWSFPKYDDEKIMPKKFTTTAEVSKSACEKAIKKISILTKDINDYVKLHIQDDMMKFTSGQTSKGDGETQIPCTIEGPALSLGVNGKHITDFLRAIQGDTVKFSMIDDSSPLILTDTQDEHYQYVIRPV